MKQIYSYRQKFAKKKERGGEVTITKSAQVIAIGHPEQTSICSGCPKEGKIVQTGSELDAEAGIDGATASVHLGKVEISQIKTEAGKVDCRIHIENEGKKIQFETCS